jgi:hypothetical protein
MVRYAIAETPAAAEKVMASVAEYAFMTEAEADRWLNGHPKPCRYRVYRMVHQRDLVWTAEPIIGAGSRLPRISSLGAMGVL